MNAYEGYLSVANKIQNITDIYNTFPYESIVFINHNDNFFGTGVRISRKKIITCAHLFYGRYP